MTADRNNVDAGAAERMRRYRARQRGEDEPKRKPGPAPRPVARPLGEYPLAGLVDELCARLAGRRMDDAELCALVDQGYISLMQGVGDYLTSVMLEPFDRNPDALKTVSREILGDT